MDKPISPPLSIKQREQLKSYQNWKISKTSLGRNPHLMKYFFNLIKKGESSSNG